MNRKLPEFRDRAALTMSGGAAPRIEHMPGTGHLYGTVSRFSMAEAAEAVAWLVRYLEQRGIAPVPGSHFERARLTTWEAAKRQIRGEAALHGDSERTLLDRLTDLAAITELAFALRPVRKHKNAGSLDYLLGLLAKPSGGKPGPQLGEVARPGLTGKEAYDENANKLFELITACYAMREGQDVDDDDDSTGGSKPDLLVTFDDVRWAFECKTLHSRNPEGFAGLLRKGVQQICDSTAERGTVLFSLRHQLNAEWLWGVEEGSEDSFFLYEDDSALVEAVRQEAQKAFWKAVNQIGTEPIAELLRGTRPLWGMQGIGYYAHAVGCVQDDDGNPRLTTVRFFGYENIVELSEGESRAASWGVNKLNHAAQMAIRRSNDV